MLAWSEQAQALQAKGLALLSAAACSRIIGTTGLQQTQKYIAVNTAVTSVQDCRFGGLFSHTEYKFASVVVVLLCFAGTPFHSWSCRP